MLEKAGNSSDQCCQKIRRGRLCLSQHLTTFSNVYRQRADVCESIYGGQTFSVCQMLPFVKCDEFTASILCLHLKFAPASQSETIISDGSYLGKTDVTLLKSPGTAVYLHSMSCSIILH